MNTKINAVESAKSKQDLLSDANKRYSEENDASYKKYKLAQMELLDIRDATISQANADFMKADERINAIRVAEQNEAMAKRDKSAGVMKK